MANALYFRDTVLTKMLFSEEDAPFLKKWIVKRLENTYGFPPTRFEFTFADYPLFDSSDADADVLADYVLALLRHDGDIDTVRQLCEAEIPDFLKEDSTIFVRDVFDAIHYKSYLPGAPPRIPPATFALAPPTGPSAHSYGNLGMGVPLGPQNGSRKRSYNDRGDGDAQDRGFQPGADSNGRLYKQPRRGGPAIGRGNFEGFNPNNGRGGGGFSGGRPSPMNLQGMPLQGFSGMAGMPSPPPGMPPFDLNNPVAAMLAMQALGIPVPGIPQAVSPVGRGPPGPPMTQKKQRCRDYDIKGFCARGNTCMFEHGEHSIWVPPANKGDEYDPTNSTLMTGVENNGTPGPTGNFSQFRGNDRGRGRGGFHRGDGRQFNNNTTSGSRRGARAEFSSDRPNYDRSKTTIVVENIPEDKFSEDEVRGFFSEFGSIVEVTMRPYKRLAIVKYEDWDSAKAAYNSPKVIFDNRFVKVYWYVSQDSLPQQPTVSGSNVTVKITTEESSPTTPAPAKTTSEPQIDIEEFTKKQEEAQRVHEEKMKKKQEMEAARKELEKRQEDLLKSQEEEKRKLMERIAAKSGKTSTSPKNGTPGLTAVKTSSQTEALKAQLAALEDEARSLGIDTSLSDDTSWGGYQGRGRGFRGGYRGSRGAYVPRGFRGGYRGRGSAPFVAGARSFNLDNRPKKVGLTGIDFSDAEKDESLRQYLLVSFSYLFISYVLTCSGHRRIH